MYVDLFCGIGGFSQASIENGKKIFLAIDNNPEVLKIYNRNINDVNTSCLDIPAEWNNIKTQIPRGSVIHASPPSKKILSWFLNEMMKGKWSWTLECDFHTDFLAVCAILLYVQSASPLGYPYILSIRYREKAWSGVRVHVSILSVHVVFTPPLRGLVY